MKLKISSADVITFLAKELLLWFTLPLLFLWFYIHHYHQPAQAGIEHLQLIGLIFFWAVSLKLLTYCIFRSNKEIRLINTSIYASILVMLAIYYLLVIVGLKSWGKVISIELISSYLMHLEDFLASINTPYLLFIVTVICFYLIAFCLILHLQVRYSRLNACYHTKPVITVLCLVSLCFFSQQLLVSLLTPNTQSVEPINLTLYSGKPYMDSRFMQRYLPHQEALMAAETKAIQQYATSDIPNKKNVILIIVDALQLKHMQLYDYKRKNTPHLSGMEKSGHLKKFQKAYASCPETACAISSLISSRMPFSLTENAFTLSQVLDKQGYYTRLILGGDHTHFYNMREFYGNPDEFYDGSMEKQYYFNDDELVLNKIRQLPNWDRTPQFMHLHLMSSHTLGTHRSNFNFYTPATSYVKEMYGDLRPEHINHYDNGVMQADHYLNSIINTLEEKNYLKNAVVIITADHGEILGEHGLVSHANGVWEELLHVPLMLMQFDEDSIKNIASASLIRQIDIAPTILHELKFVIPNTWQGRPLQVSGKLGAESRQTDDKLAFYRWPPYTGLYDFSDSKRLLKYWINLNTGEEYLYEITSDPNEKNNLAFDVSYKSLKKIWIEKIKSNQSLTLNDSLFKH